MNAAERWLAFSRDDLRAAEVLLKEEVYSLACFHAQQAVEKALKALLASRHPDQNLPRTHSISELMARLGEVCAQLLDAVDTLDAFYIPTRYPDALPGSLPGGLPGAGEADEMVELAREVPRFVSTSGMPGPCRRANKMSPQGALFEGALEGDTFAGPDSLTRSGDSLEEPRVGLETVFEPLLNPDSRSRSGNRSSRNRSASKQ